jgi:autoinducer 2-degrading protein
MTVVLAVTWVAREGENYAVAELLRRLAPLSRAEPGCLQYDVHRDPDDPNRFFLFERYADDEALEAHMASPHVQELGFGDAFPRLETRQRTTLIPLV